MRPAPFSVSVPAIGKIVAPDHFSAAAEIWASAMEMINAVGGAGLDVGHPGNHE
jgi:hypothetical protein